MASCQISGHDRERISRDSNGCILVYIANSRKERIYGRNKGAKWWLRNKNGCGRRGPGMTGYCIHPAANVHPGIVKVLGQQVRERIRGSGGEDEDDERYTKPKPKPVETHRIHS